MGTSAHHAASKSKRNSLSNETSLLKGSGSGSVITLSSSDSDCCSYLSTVHSSSWHNVSSLIATDWFKYFDKKSAPHQLTLWTSLWNSAIYIKMLWHLNLDYKTVCPVVSVRKGSDVWRYLHRIHVIYQNTVMGSWWRKPRGNHVRFNSLLQIHLFWNPLEIIKEFMGTVQICFGSWFSWQSDPVWAAHI